MEQEQVEMGVEESVPPTETEEVVEEVAAEPNETGAEEQDRAADGLKAATVAERKKRQEAERRAQEAEARLKQFEAQQPKEVPEQSLKPRLDDYDDHESYYEALTDWKIQEREREAVETAIKKRQEIATQTIAESVANMHKSGRSEYEDWDTVTNVDTLPVTETMRDTLLNIDNGTKVFYHLGKNPDEAVRIAQLPPLKQSVEIARLETRLAAQTTRKNKSEAPEPITPVGAKNSGATLTPSELASRDPKEFIRQRNEGLI